MMTEPNRTDPEQQLQRAENYLDHLARGRGHSIADRRSILELFAVEAERLAIRGEPGELPDPDEVLDRWERQERSEG